MNIIKRFARWVLREDWEIASIRIRTLQNDLRKRNEKIDDLQHQLNVWTIKTHLNESSILPQSAVKSVIDCLPNPNDAAIGKLSARKSDIYFSHVVRGKNVKHLVRLEKFYSINDVIHAQVKIHDLNISITLSLKRHKLNYNMFGVNSEIETYYWDFNFSNIKIISDDVFDFNFRVYYSTTKCFNRIMIKLKVNKEAKKFADELEKEYPSLKSYHDLISKEVGCPWEEVVYLDVHPDNAIGDEEGWQIESFFPRGIDPETSVINDDYNTKDFSVGLVVRLKHDGATFVAETNASPWTIYANPKTIEVW